MKQPTPTELITTSLEKLSNDLHSQIHQYLQKTTQQQQAQVTQALSSLIPNLLEQLIPIINEEIQHQLKPQQQAMEICLQELKNTNQQQLKMLKLGREEYQHLQVKMSTILTDLEKASRLDDSEIQTSLNELKTSVATLTTSMATLQTSMTTLKKSVTDENDDIYSLPQIAGNLTILQEKLENAQTSLEQQQALLTNYLEQVKPLLG